jgi:LysM repeat protein
MARNILSTMPVLLVGSLALATLNLGGTVEATPKRPHEPKSDTSDLTTAVRNAVASAAAGSQPVVAATPAVAELTTESAPTNYTVKAGDTVSGIAERYQLSTATILALNGLSWSSLIFPGQVLKLTKTVAAPTTPATTSTPTTSTPATYTVKAGDTVSGIAGRYNLSTATVLALNGLSTKSLIFPGQVLKLTSTTAAPTPAPTTPVTTTPVTTTPVATTPVTTAPTSAPTTSTPTTSTPATYTVKAGDTVSGIAGRYKLSTATVLALNGLTTKSLIFPGQVLKLTSTTAAPTPAPTTPVATAPTSSPTTTTTSTTYTIKSGDTVTSIAAKYGVTVTAILDANGLSASSIIYSGRTLIIPGTSTTEPAQVGTSITPLSPSMKANALTIIAVGQKLNVPSYGIIIALSAAAQESGLINLSGGDRDSVGLFQQRPSTGWGTVAQLENTTYASELFYGGPSNPNKGKTRGLLDIPNWQSMTVTEAAQAVEISAYPDAYAQWQASATAWLAELT